MQITRKDVIWNYSATFLKVAANALLLPFILTKMSSETVGIWSIFMTIVAFCSLVDFGFSPAFTRNISYIFSGVRSLKVNGVENVEGVGNSVDFGLLKGVISAMQWFYLRVSIILFLLLSTIGTYYIVTILHYYKGNRAEVYIAWSILCLINSYNIYTLYYDALLQGRGLIKKSKQIVVLGQSMYLIVAAILVIAGKNLIALISAQAISIIVIRWLSYKTFFTDELKRNIQIAFSRSKKEIISTISPNAVKIGLTTLGGLIVQRSAIVIGSLFLPLEDIASYGITIQLITIISGLSLIFSSTYQPKISQLFVLNDKPAIKDLYLKGQIILFLTYFIFGGCILVFGHWSLHIMGSRTNLVSSFIMIVLLIISLLEANHSQAGSILLSKNEVPFFKASIFAGALVIIILIVLFRTTYLNLWAMVIAQGMANLYNNWKWPHEVYKLLNIRGKDLFHSVSELKNGQ